MSGDPIGFDREDRRVLVAEGADDGHAHLIGEATPRLKLRR
ncbi:MAG: hypothetical protein ACEQSX_08835 [Baekduiaceae bacterium]